MRRLIAAAALLLAPALFAHDHSQNISISTDDYEDVTLQRVADAAEVSLKTIVRHFATKDALLVTCAKRYRPRALLSIRY